MVWLGALSQKSKNSRFKLGKGFNVVSDQKNYHHREKKESLGYT
jgi:hypothetical protein